MGSLFCRPSSGEGKVPPLQGRPAAGARGTASSVLRASRSQAAAWDPGVPSNTTVEKYTEVSESSHHL